MPARKTNGDPAPAAAPEVVAPAPAPPADDQEEITLPDGTVATVDKAFADALKAAAKKAPPASVKQPPAEA